MALLDAATALGLVEVNRAMGGWVRARRAELRKFFATLSEFDAPLLPSLWRVARLLFRDQFSPDEVFMLALLDPKKREVDLQNYFSKEKLLHLQLSLNPNGARTLTADKIAFYRHCADGGISTPVVVCVASARVRHSNRGLPFLSCCADWVEFFSRSPVRSIVIKPVAGAHGHGVLALDLLPEGYRDSTGRILDAQAVFGHFSRFEYDLWIVQERLTSHANLTGLSGTSYLQTARIVTYIDTSGSVTLLGARLRLIGGSATTDNFSFGLSGNIIASIDASSGRIKNAVMMRPSLLGLVRISRHPVTGREIVGFQVPFWSEVLALTKQASRHFVPLRTVGWDVAITDSGVILIEGNETWDSGFYDLDFTNEYNLLQQCALRDPGHSPRGG